MRVLLLCSRWRESRSPDTITGLAQVYCHYLGEGLRKRGCRISYLNMPGVRSTEAEKQHYLDVQKLPARIDHVLGCEQDLVTHHVRNCGSWLFYQAIRPKVGGLITSVYDRPRIDSLSDVLFTAIDNRGIPGTVYLGPAVDPDVFVSRQDPLQLTICLDHRMTARDIGDGLAEQCAAIHGFADVIRLPERTVQRRLADSLARSHVFIPTHPESFGLSVIEAGIAGCLVVAKREFVHADVLRHVEHIVYDNEIPWPVVMDRVDPARCRATALRTADRWDECAQIVFETFQSA